MNQQTELEEAIALGFDSVSEMHAHQAWLDNQKALHAAAVAYQATPESQARKQAIDKEIGITQEQIAWVQP